MALKTLLILDLDKTLVKLPVDIQRVRKTVAELMEKSGIEGPPRPLLQVLEAMHKRGGDELKSKCEALIANEELKAVEHAQPMPGLNALDDMLQDKIWAVLTNNSSKVVKPVLKKFMNHLPPIVVGRDIVARGKPHPDGLHRVLEIAKAESFVFVGDSFSDEQTVIHANLDHGEFLGVGVVYKNRTLLEVVETLMFRFQ